MWIKGLVAVLAVFLLTSCMDVDGKKNKKSFWWKTIDLIDQDETRLLGTYTFQQDWMSMGGEAKSKVKFLTDKAFKDTRASEIDLDLELFRPGVGQIFNLGFTYQFNNKGRAKETFAFPAIQALPGDELNMWATPRLGNIPDGSQFHYTAQLKYQF
jgi:hypothetical protein